MIYNSMYGVAGFLTRWFQQRHGLHELHVRADQFGDDGDYLGVFAKLGKVVVVDGHPKQPPDGQLWISGSNRTILDLREPEGTETNNGSHASDHELYTLASLSCFT